MKVTLIMRVEVEIEVAPGETEQAKSDATYQVEKALDYWFDHTERPMSNVSVAVA